MAEVAVFKSTDSGAAIAVSGKGTPPKELPAAKRKASGPVQNMRGTVIQTDGALTWKSIAAALPCASHRAFFIFRTVGVVLRGRLQ